MGKDKRLQIISRDIDVADSRRAFEERPYEHKRNVSDKKSLPLPGEGGAQRRMRGLAGVFLHLISRLPATASPQGEALDSGPSAHPSVAWRRHLPEQGRHGRQVSAKRTPLRYERNVAVRRGDLWSPEIEQSL